MKFYVYELIDPRDGSVFYVGKGTRKRIKQHVWDSTRSRENTPKANKIRRILAAGFEVLSRKVFETDDEAEAYAVEASLIRQHGRENLTNTTDGGKGGSSGHSPSQETRAAMSRAHAGRTKSAETRSRMAAVNIGKRHGPETRAKISAANRLREHRTGWTHSAETRAKLSAALAGRGLGPKGERQGNAKLKPDDIAAIFAMKAQGMSQRAIGQRFGIHQVTVSKILLGKTWAHLAGTV